jgi:signal transduction histidine kinase
LGDEEKLQSHLRAITHRSGRTLALFLACFGIARLPIFGGLEELRTPQSVMRMCIVVIQLGIWALMHTRFAARRPLLVLSPGALLIMAVSGFEAGNLGDAQHPWIYLSFPSLCVSVLAPVGLGRRIFLVALGTLALVVPFIAPHPHYLAAPMTRMMLGFAFVVLVLVVAVGHLVYRVTEQSFYQSLALERASAELAGLNETLESRVRAQTNDLRRLAEHLDTAREDERARISRDLHDDLGQELTALHLALSLARERFAREPKRIEGNLADMAALLDRTRATARRIVTELRPQVLDDLGLHASLEWLMTETERRSLLRCRLHGDGLDTLPSEVSAIAFRVVQEALTNVVRHAEARNVDVRLGVHGPSLEIAVEDDGVGIRAESTSGVGLIGLRERVTARGGTMALVPPRAGGTRLSVSLPIATGATS